MSGPAIVITGPSGWIGTALLAKLAADRPGSLPALRLFGSRAGPLAAPDGSMLQVRALDSIRPEDVADAFVIHLAYLTKEKAELLGERQFFDTNLAIDEALLAALRGAAPRAVFVASSGAASLAESGRDRHPYGIAKLLQEDRFIGYGMSAGVPVLPGRIFNIAGPFINKLPSYAISSFITQAHERGAIAIDATMPVYRSYLHVDDLCSIIVDGLAAGVTPGRAVDLCGPEVVEMGRLARLVADAMGLGDAAVTRGPIAFDRVSAYLGDATQTDALSLRLSLALRPLTTQIADTIGFLLPARAGAS